MLRAMGDTTSPQEPLLMATNQSEDFPPVLPGRGDSDYERYLRPDELLALQPKPGDWTGEGGIGRMFTMMKPFQPPPPAGAGSPFARGDPDHVEELLGDAFELEFEVGVSIVRFESAEDYWHVMSENYGPTKVLADSLGGRREELHRTWVDFFEQNYRSNDEIADDREYLLTLGARR
jgi:hypothetical protein